ncbi:DUF72 domain-containing protein [Cesiribacter andamanensis]|nr:DUF72 domain-containing protein [Cesiribacter andamanensis]
MKFGRLDSPEGHAFNLPPSHPLTSKVLPGRPALLPRVHIGCSVWSEKGYKGRIFPPRTPQGRFLETYARQLPTVELNGTHYYLPRPEVVASWMAAVPEGFLFCPKVPQFITHRRNMLGNPEMIEQFILRLAAMEGHLGPCIMQMPPYFGPDRLDELARLLEALPQDIAMALEVRHPAWFADTAAQDELFALMEASGTHAILSDVGGRRDALHMRLSSRKVLVRFNGHNLHPTDYHRLNAWALQLQEWMEEGLEEVFFFMHQPEQGLGADLARYFIRTLNARLGLGLPEPIWYGEQQQLSLYTES